jgi:DNA repair exonuclease SbcCD ATPase subunit
LDEKEKLKMDRARQIADLRQRAAAIDAKLAELGDRRKTFALGAVEGNKASTKAIQELDAETDRLRREQETLVAALDHLERLKAEEERAELDQERRHREGEARIFSERVLNLDAQIDAAMVGLRELFEKRAAVIQKLAGTGVVDKVFALRLLQNAGPTSAAHAAGLRKFIGLNHVPPDRIAPLTQIDKAIRRPTTDRSQRAA